MPQRTEMEGFFSITACGATTTNTLRHPPPAPTPLTLSPCS